MSKAYKCDVCGKLFESRLVPFWIKSAIKPDKMLDICRNCETEFKHWLNFSIDTTTKVVEELSKEIDDNIRETHQCCECVHYKEPLDSDICASCHIASNFIEPSCSICKYGDLYSFDEPCAHCIRETHSLFEYNREKNKEERSCSNCIYANVSGSESPCVECVEYEKYKRRIGDDQ